MRIEIEWSRVRFWFLAVAFLMGTMNAVLLIGIESVDPTNIAWLKNDPATHYLGWAFLRDDTNWSFPPTFTTRLGYPLGVSISFNDSIPLLAVMLKPFSAMLPEPFQYLGLYTCLLMVLQAYFGFRLSHALCRGNVAFTTVGGLFLLFAPAVTWRVLGHFALASHWLILVAFVQYFRLDSVSNNKAIVSLLLIVILAGAINPYIGIMALLVALAAFIRLTMERRVSLWQFTGLGALAVATLGATFFVFGFLTGDDISDYGGTGYGYYSMNLLAPLDPMGFGSLLLKELPTATSGQYEGYNYLGLGIIVLLVLGLVRQFKAIRDIFSARLFPLLILSILCTALAVSSSVTVGSIVVVNLEFPDELETFLSAFRASGRLFWPVHYLFLLVAIALTYRSWRARCGIVLFALALVLQLVDLNPLRNAVRETAARPATWNTLSSPVWGTLNDHHAKLIVVPPWQCGAKNSPGGRESFAIFGMLASAQDMKLNSYYTGRLSNAERRVHCSLITNEVRSGNLDPTAAYVVNDRILISLHLAAMESHVCKIVDGFNLCVRKSGLGDDEGGAEWVGKLAQLGEGRHRVAENSTGAEALVLGWSPVGSGGAWTVSTPSRLAFRVDEKLIGSELKLTLNFVALMVDGRQGYEIKYRNKVIAEDTIITESGDKLHRIEAVIRLKADRRGVIVLDIEPERMASPASQGLNNDQRPLGLNLAEIVVERR